MKVAGAPSESAPTYLNENETMKVVVAPTKSVPTYLNVNESKLKNQVLPLKVCPLTLT